MNKLFILFYISCAILCSCNKSSAIVSSYGVTTIHDTIQTVDTVQIAVLQQRIKQLEDSLHYYRDTIPLDVYMNARRIEKIKYYIKIVEKNSKNKKYFYGWIRRVMSE